MKKRLDQILVDNGLVETRNRAQALIMAGQVFAEGHMVSKSGMKIDTEANICVKELFPYVSRGALKLEKAFIEFNLDFTGKTVCDIGSSTGGFTDFALQNGAAKSYCIDVGTGQLAQKIREDQRVVTMEKTDFRDVTICHNAVIPTEAEESSSVRSRDVARDDSYKKCIIDPIDIFVCDVSFISLEKIIPKVKDLIVTRQTMSSLVTNPGISIGPSEGDPRIRKDGSAGVDVILLIKPQFEAGVKDVSKGKGVIRDEGLRQEIVSEIKGFAQDYGFLVVGLTESPITGAKGNVEYLLYLKYPIITRGESI